MNPSIRLRACLAVVENHKILLVPHFDTDAGPIQWQIPGGGVEFGEYAADAALREFREETGFEGECDKLLTIHETINPVSPWHSVTLVYTGRIAGGEMTHEETPWGIRTPRWFSLDDLRDVAYHPSGAVTEALRSGD